MMIDLNLKIEKNNTYINYGTIFSRLLFLRETLTNNESFLIVVENESNLNTYLKIASFLKIDIFGLSNLSDFSNLFYNNIGKYIATKDIFSFNIDNISNFEYKNIFNLKVGQKISIQDITKKLNEFNYKFSNYDNSGSFRIIGDIFSFTDFTNKTLKISFWGDEIEEILYDNKKLDFFTFGQNQLIQYENNISNVIKQKVIDLNSLLIIDSLDFYSFYDDISEKKDNYIFLNSITSNKNSIDLQISDLHINSIDELTHILSNKSIKKFIFTKNKKTINNYLDLNNIFNVTVIDTNINTFKSFKSEKFLVLADDNISRIFVKKRIKRNMSKNLDLLMQIKPGDYIVHIDHGIGIFKEIESKDLGGIKKEYITIEYKDNDKLFVPITEVGRVSKYVGLENPKLTALSTKQWEKSLAKASKEIEIIAQDLLDLYAKRQTYKGFSFASNKKLETEFFNSFEYVYTDDQINVINEIYKDMESENPMDRLLCGDVGFGKTEIAFAAIYKSIINGKQAAFISPLVVLAYEHLEKAISRFANFPINIGVITRFEKASHVKITLEKLKNGQIDLIIGTHRLLSEDIIFKDLGVLIIDEEHKFGVKDKEKIKQFKGNIDVLSMSATPIPRSLNMALNGIKSMSMLTTPPVGRQDIQTIVSAFDEKLIISAAKREFERGGQIFFIHNRVDTIQAIGTYLSTLLAGKKIVIAHGQLAGDTLEKRIIEFKRKEFDVLLATTVIENGIDFSNVNTIFINDAGNLGISQIHQLRGRVGRSDKKGYCYLLFKKDKIKEDTAKRLKTIVDYSHLGAGFELAIKDLEIRGGGDLLGIRQSGQSNEIGVNLFLEMLENKIEELKISQINPILGGEENALKIIRINTQIDINIPAYIDDIYFTSELDKLNFYREIESLDNIIDLENIISDFNEINENISNTTKNFFSLLKLKLKASEYKISSIKKVGINYQIDFSENIILDDLKKVLKLDFEVKFGYVNSTRLRTLVKNFENDEKFIQYLLQIFNSNSIKKKIKLKKSIL